MKTSTTPILDRGPSRNEAERILNRVIQIMKNIRDMQGRELPASIADQFLKDMKTIYPNMPGL